MIAIAVIAMTVLHPSFVFGDEWKRADFRLGSVKVAQQQQRQAGMEKESPSSSSWEAEAVAEAKQIPSVSVAPYEQRRYG